MRRAAIGLALLVSCAETEPQSPPPVAPRAPAPAAASCSTLPAARNPNCYEHLPPSEASRPPSATASDGRDGGLSKEQINVVVRKHLVEIKCCYEAGLEKDRSLSGAVIVGWTITPAGQVSRSWVMENTLPSEPTIACIAERVCDWEFPGREMPTTVGRYPFVFKN